MTDAILDRAIEEWAQGDYYEAHETLEDVLDELDDADEAGFEIVIALVQIAASLHKLANDVGAQAVPGKLARALTALESTPAWRELDLAALSADVRALLGALESGAKPAALPRLRRAS